MNLRQIETFVMVARLGSFSATASKIGSTQPAVSMRIQELEAQLGVVLFDRSQRRVRLTPKGRECLAYAEQVLGSVADMASRISAGRSIAGRINLGVSDVIAQTWLPALLAQLAAEYPDLVVDPTIDMTLSLLRRLHDGEFDVVLTGGRRFTDEFAAVDLGSTTYVWACRPRYLDCSRPASPQDLQSHRILCWSGQAVLTRMMDEWFQRHGAAIRQRIVSNSTMLVLQLTKAGLGISLLPHVLIARDVAEGLLTQIPTTTPFDPVHYCALYQSAHWPPFGRIVAELAHSVSTFDR